MVTPGVFEGDAPPVRGESFYLAQRRHRRAGRLLAAAALVTGVGQAVVACAVLTPFTILLAVAVSDLVNLVTPVTDVYAVLGERWVAVVAAATGVQLAWLLPFWLVLSARLRTGALGAALHPRSRPPDDADPAEHRLVNVVAEMAVAAGLPEPRLLVVDRGANLVLLGATPADAVLVVPRQVLDQLDRRQLRAAVAHQIAAIATGDLEVAAALTAPALVWGVPQQLTTHPFRLRTWWAIGQLVRLLARRLDPVAEARLVVLLLDTGVDDAEESRFFLTQLHRVMMSVFWMSVRILAGFLPGLLLNAWVRRRRLLDDALAVQLTREPDALAAALFALTDAGGHAPGGVAVDLGAVVAAGSSGYLFGLTGGWHPSTRLRLRQLEAYGYHPDRAERAARTARLTELEPRSLSDHSTLGKAWRLVLGVPAVGVLLALFLAVTAVLGLYVALVFYVLPAYLVLIPLHGVSR